MLLRVGDGVPQAGTLLRRPGGRIGQVTRCSAVRGQPDPVGAVGLREPTWNSRIAESISFGLSSTMK